MQPFTPSDSRIAEFLDAAKARGEPEFKRAFHAAAAVHNARQLAVLVQDMLGELLPKHALRARTVHEAGGVAFDAMIANYLLAADEAAKVDFTTVCNLLATDIRAMEADKKKEG